MTEPNPIVETIKALYAAAEGTPACEHCDADDELIELDPGVLIFEIRHDDNCPFYRSRKSSAKNGGG